MKAEECIKLLTLLAENKVEYNVDFLYKRIKEPVHEHEHASDFWSDTELTNYYFTYIINQQLYYIIVDYNSITSCWYQTKYDNEYECDDITVKFYKSRFNKFVLKPTEQDIKLIDSFYIGFDDYEDRKDTEENQNAHKIIDELYKLICDLQEPAISILNIIETIENK